jgi:hypothetical protein
VVNQRLNLNDVMEYCKTIKQKQRCRDVALEILKLKDYNITKLSDLDFVDDTEKKIVVPYEGHFKTKKVRSITLP